MPARILPEHAYKKAISASSLSCAELQISKTLSMLPFVPVSIKNGASFHTTSIGAIEEQEDDEEGSLLLAMKLWFWLQLSTETFVVRSATLLPDVAPNCRLRTE